MNSWTKCTRQRFPPPFSLQLSLVAAFSSFTHSFHPFFFHLLSPFCSIWAPTPIPFLSQSISLHYFTLFYFTSIPSFLLPCHYLQWATMLFHFPLSLHAVFLLFCDSHLDLSFFLLDTTRQPGELHLPIPLCQAGNHIHLPVDEAGVMTHTDTFTHMPHSYTHTIHSPSIFPTLLSTFHFSRHKLPKSARYL